MASRPRNVKIYGRERNGNNAPGKRLNSAVTEMRDHRPSTRNSMPAWLDHSYRSYQRSDARGVDLDIHSVHTSTGSMPCEPTLDMVVDVVQVRQIATRSTGPSAQ